MKRFLQCNLLLFGFLFVVSASVFSQVPPKPKAVDFLGTVHENTYRNDYFGFTLTFPKGWIVADRETTDAATKVGLDVLKGKNERDNKAIEDSLSKEVVLLNVTKKPVGALGNAVFMMGTRKQMSDAVTASMVAEATKSLFDSSPTLRLVADTRVRTIGGRKFALLDYALQANGQTATIKYFVTVVKGYAISFSLSYDQDTDLAELQKVVESLQFASN